jgi:hypothetical protein
METTVAELEAEQQQIGARIDGLRSELTALQTRLLEIARAIEQKPRFHPLRTHIRLVASAEPGKYAPAAVKVVPAGVPDQPVDPLHVLRQAGRGSALFAPRDVDGAREAITLLVRGESRRAAALGEDPAIEFRAGAFTLPELGVVLVPVLVRIGPKDEVENLYEAWVNESATGLKATLKGLAVQEQIVVYLYGDDGGLERVFHVPNPLRVFAQETLNLAGGTRPLSADEFHQARTAVYKLHPTVSALWKALEVEGR